MRVRHPRLRRRVAARAFADEHGYGPELIPDGIERRRSAAEA
ncbi:hypothetical protein [Agromyces sp. ZXT2-6]